MLSTKGKVLVFCILITGLNDLPQLNLKPINPSLTRVTSTQNIAR